MNLLPETMHILNLGHKEAFSNGLLLSEVRSFQCNIFTSTSCFYYCVIIYNYSEKSFVWKIQFIKRSKI